MSQSPPPGDFFDRAIPTSQTPHAASGEPMHGEGGVAPITFYQVLLQSTPRVYVTPALIAINALVFIAMAVTGGGFWEPSTEFLQRWGADFGPLTTNGQWWRMFTSMFVHIGLIHIGMNMFVLAVAGPLVERLLGNVGFLIAYVIAGLAGSLASTIHAPDMTSAGASGAIFGVYGALMGFVALRRDTIPKPVLVNLLRSALIFVVYNVVYGLRDPHIDISAHIGGIVGGLVCGLMLSQPLSPAARHRRWMRNLLTVMVGGVAIVLIARTIPADALLMFDEFHDVERRTVDAFVRLQDKNLSGTERVDALNKECIVPWRDELKRLENFESTHKLRADQARRLSLLIEYMKARLTLWENQAQLNIEASEAKRAELMRKQNIEKQEFERLLGELNSDSKGQ